MRCRPTSGDHRQEQRGRAFHESFGKVWDEENLTAHKKVLARGNKINEFSAADMEAMKKATAGVEQEWIKQVGEKGLDGKSWLPPPRTGRPSRAGQDDVKPQRFVVWIGWTTWRLPFRQFRISTLVGFTISVIRNAKSTTKPSAASPEFFVQHAAIATSVFQIHLLLRGGIS